MEILETMTKEELLEFILKDSEKNIREEEEYDSLEQE